MVFARNKCDVLYLILRRKKTVIKPSHFYEKKVKTENIIIKVSAEIKKKKHSSKVPPKLSKETTHSLWFMVHPLSMLYVENHVVRIFSSLN